MSGHVWHGRAGAVALGPTQHRVARYLEDLTSHGWAHVRTADLAERLGLERSEAFRILSRLRVLGLFGVSNDRGGHAGGRRVWRTARRHDGARLDPSRHQVAWARIRGAVRAARIRTRDRLVVLRSGQGHAPDLAPASQGAPPALPTFAARMRAAGLGQLMDTWGVT